MIHQDFDEPRQVITALPPDQMRLLREALDRKLAESVETKPSGEGGEPDADPLIGLWHDYADEMDQIVADAYRRRREEPWREFDL